VTVALKIRMKTTNECKSQARSEHKYRGVGALSFNQCILESDVMLLRR
jgi:hypothetical protein